MSKNALKTEKIYQKPKIQVLLFQSNDDICATMSNGDNDFDVSGWDNDE